MVLNRVASDLQTGNYDAVRAEVQGLVDICHHSSSNGVIICKIILETCYLTKEQIVQACEIGRDAGVDFVKTSTGFGGPAAGGGANVEDVRRMRDIVAGTTVGE
jgi:deoxyribose-phosphate aldolase